MRRKQIYDELTKGLPKPLSPEAKEMAHSLVEAVRHHRGLPARVKVRTLEVPIGPLQVKAFRKAMGFSQSQCAKALLVKVETVKKWEQGGNPVSGPAAQWVKAGLLRPKVVEDLLTVLEGR